MSRVVEAALAQPKQQQSATQPTDAVSRGMKAAFLCLFLIGAMVRVIGVWRPVDQASWRECDMAGVARNYYREGMNILYPRIDWRGDGPGYAEMEFPIYPWSMAVLYKLFGIHEFFGRILSFAFSLVSLAVFLSLARYLLPEAAAIGASTFFALSPLVIRTSKSLQPDGLMFLCYLLAAYAFIRWVDSDSWKYYFIAFVSTALAILAKAPAAHIGLFFAGLLLWKRGFRSLRQVRVWFFGAASLLPGALWYVHAHRFWTTYGNSLGLSNEYHWAGWDLFTNPSFVLGIGRSELTYVWMPAGALIILAGWFYRRSASAAVFSSLWFCAILVYYLVAARTTGDDWAIYYHVVSVPPIALLFGAGVSLMDRLAWPRELVVGLIVTCAAIAATAAIALGLYDLTIVAALKAISKHRLVVGGIVVGLFLMIGILYARRQLWLNSVKMTKSLSNPVAAYLVLICTALTLLSEARVIRNDISSRADTRRGCATEFARSIPPADLILCSGGACKDPAGYPVAYNASYMFYWMDRKGLNICVEDQSLESVRSFAKRGAAFFVADQARLKEKPGFETELVQTFPLIQECSGELFFDIRSEVARTK